MSKTSKKYKVLSKKRRKIDETEVSDAEPCEETTETVVKSIHSKAGGSKAKPNVSRGKLLIGSAATPNFWPSIDSRLLTDLSPAAKKGVRYVYIRINRLFFTIMSGDWSRLERLLSTCVNARPLPIASLGDGYYVGKWDAASSIDYGPVVNPLMAPYIHYHDDFWTMSLAALYRKDVAWDRKREAYFSLYDAISRISANPNIWGRKEFLLDIALFFLFEKQDEGAFRQVCDEEWPALVSKWFGNVAAGFQWFTPRGWKKEMMGDLFSATTALLEFCSWRRDREISAALKEVMISRLRLGVQLSQRGHVYLLKLIEVLSQDLNRFNEIQEILSVWERERQYSDYIIDSLRLDLAEMIPCGENFHENAATRHPWCSKFVANTVAGTDLESHRKLIQQWVEYLSYYQNASDLQGWTALSNALVGAFITWQVTLLVTNVDFVTVGDAQSVIELPSWFVDLNLRGDDHGLLGETKAEIKSMLFEDRSAGSDVAATADEQTQTEPMESYIRPLTVAFPLVTAAGREPLFVEVAAANRL